jgi:biopolymer transport protein ExbD
MGASVRPDSGESEEIIAEINITPLTDVFLVLLIIFMVTSSVIANTGKKVDLPEAVQQSQTPPKAVNVTITEDGIVQVNDQVVKPELLRAYLEKALKASDNKTVVLRGDRKVVLEQAVYVLDQAQLAAGRGGPGGAAGAPARQALRPRAQAQAPARSSSSGSSSPTPWNMVKVFWIGSGSWSAPLTATFGRSSMADSCCVAQWTAFSTRSRL